MYVRKSLKNYNKMTYLNILLYIKILNILLYIKIRIINANLIKISPTHII